MPNCHTLSVTLKKEEEMQQKGSISPPVKFCFSEIASVPSHSIFPQGRLERIHIPPWKQLLVGERTTVITERC
jgi:hypothetical protein